MTSFGWKRKAGQSVSRDTSTAFELNAKADEDIDVESGVIDWLGLQRQAAKRPCLEDGRAKAARLREEGATLAGEERYWEALKKWDGALELTPDEAVIYEMKAQAYLALGEVYPALTAASRAVSLDPRWWPAHQTLGRTHLGLGEVRLALRCFQVAVHINPTDEELWESDLQWANTLLQRKHAMQEQRDAENEKSGATIQPLEEESSEEEEESSEEEEEEAICPEPHDQKIKERTCCGPLDHIKNTKDNEDDRASASEPQAEAVKHLPNNYILMRDPVA